MFRALSPLIIRRSTS